jgi:hypothetical protein
MGVIGCPNLGPEPAKIGEEVMPNGKGVLMVAVRGEGSFSVRAVSLILEMFRLNCVTRDRSQTGHTLSSNSLARRHHRIL